MEKVYLIEEEINEVNEQLVLFYPNLNAKEDYKKDFFL